MTNGACNNDYRHSLAKLNMGNFDDQRFASNSQEWETPESIFLPLNKEFEFTLDVAATKDNAKCSKYYAQEDNALEQSWHGVCWMNPPFKELGKWVKKAYEESLRGVTVVCLIPARTNTNWWHDYCMKGEVRFIKGRPKFNNAKHGLPFPLAIVIFRAKIMFVIISSVKNVMVH